MTSRTLDTTLLLDVMGHQCELEVTLHYDFQRADGDGWHEPRIPEHVSLESVAAQGFNLLPLLSPKCIASIEADLLQHEQDERQPDPDYLRERALERTV